MPALMTSGDLDAMAAELPLREQVALVRHHNAQIRRLARRVLTEPVLNNTTQSALDRRRRLVALAERRLAEQGHRELAGLLAEERQLRMRLQPVPWLIPRTQRPELIERLRKIESRIRKLLVEA